MSEAKHTPGPWDAPAIEMSKDMAAMNVVAAGSISICEVFRVSSMFGGNEETFRANARVITAAPDMLAALKRLVEQVNLCHSNPCAAKGHPDCRYRQAADAIKKAEAQ